MSCTNGECSECHSENIDYGAISPEDDMVYYPYTCNDCGHNGKEWYELKYANSD